MSAFKLVGFPGISDPQSSSGTSRSNRSMVISRRVLLGGLSAMPLATSLMGCAARGQSGPAAPTGPVGPGSTWNGTPLSGGTPPSDPTRTTAKPAVHWLFPSDLRLVNNLVIGVDADARGGVRQVDFWVEGAVYSIATPAISNDTDANGQTRTRYGYWITLDATKFRAISTTGSARIFATAIPNDPTMQSRTIGITSGDAVADNFRGDYAMVVYPRAAANDWIKTVAPSGADYTTIATAIAAARAASAEAPLITITATGAYELANAADNYANGKGFCTITTSSGVTATLGRAAAFTPNSPASWPWTPGWDGIEFRGSGVVFDQRNWSTIAFTAKPGWFNGCKFTNSIGTLYSYYWNGSIHPGFGANNSNYWDDVTVERVSRQGAVSDQRYVRGCTFNQWSADLFTGTQYVAGNYVRYFDTTFFIGTFQGVLNFVGLRINGPANATVSKTAGDAQGGSLLLRVSGATVATIPLGFYGNDTNPTIDAVVTAINAFGAGWTASAQNGRGTMRPSLLGAAGNNASTFTDVVASATLDLNSGTDIHADWWQGYTGGATRENVIIRNNTTRDAGATTALNAVLFMDATLSQDFIVKGNVWTGDYGTTSVGGTAISHLVFENNSIEAAVTRIQSPTGDQTYSSFKNNTIGLLAYNAAGTWVGDAPWINNEYMIANGNSAISGGSNSGNFTVANPGGNQTTNFRTLFVDYANGDYRPAPGGALFGTSNANLKPRVNPYDGRGGAIAASDVVGARSKDGAGPSYPF